MEPMPEPAMNHPVSVRHQRVRTGEDGDARLRRIIDAMADAVLVVDGDGVVQFANPAAGTLFGRPRREMTGTPFGFPLVGGGTTEVDLQQGRVAEMRVVDLSWEGRPAWLASLRDVTERKLAEEAERRLLRERTAREEAEKERQRLDLLHRELEAAMERLRAEEQRKDQFMAVLGHELRNPLAGIDGGLRLLQHDRAGEKASWALAMMRKQVSLLTSLLDDLLDVSRIARGKLELRRRRICLGRVVESAAAAVSPRIGERKQRLSIHLAGEPLAADADPERMEQVLSNLLVNASKFSKPGDEIRIELRRDGRELVLEVSDPGSGIPPDMLDQIFEPFIQGSQQSPLAGGLGIGLTLVKQLVELHGGSVSAASPGPGRGATFEVRLPAAEPAEGDDASPATPEAPNGNGHRVLVIDDNEDAARALAELLELNGCEVATAACGIDGLARARALRPDAVLLDLDLPDVSGYEVAEELRRDGDLETTLLIAVSGFGHEQARERSRSCGIHHHLLKPVEVDRLLRLFAAGPGAP